MTFLPQQVILEVTSRCNLGCKGCAVHGPERYTTRSLGDMTEEIWKPAIDEIGSWKKKVNLTTHGGGEPLLHPNLDRILVHAKKYPDIEVGFLTNGMLLDQRWSEFIVERNLNWVAFSIDGVDPKTHRIVRKKSDLRQIEKNLLTLIGLKEKSGVDKPSIMLNMVAYDEVADQAEAFLNKWLDRVNGITVSHFRNPPESRRWPNTPENRQPCYLLWNQMVISWDGKMALCCEDFNADHILGNTGSKSLLEIWNGDGMDEIRKLHEKGDYHLHPLCVDCDTWADYMRSETIEESKGRKKAVRVSQTEYTKFP